MNKKSEKPGRIHHFLKSKGNRIFLENIASLSVLQVASYLLPLLTFPYLVRVLGIGKFGLLVFAQEFVKYFIVLSDYGFDFTATREISIHRDDGRKISRIFSTVMAVKLLILIIGFFVMILLVLLFAKLREHTALYLLTFGWAVGHALFPQWFFQGMEKMKYIALLNIFAKLFFTITIFIFVKSANDYLYQPLLYSLGFIFSGLIAQYKVRKDFNVRFVMPAFKDVKRQLADGWHVFLSTVSVSIYTTSNTIILGILTSTVYVGYFAVADKLVYAAKILITPIKQALFPVMSKKFNESRQIGLKIARKVLKIVCAITFSESIGLFLCAGFLVKAVLGTECPQAVLALRIMSFLPFIIGINNVLGAQVMLPMAYNKAFSYIIMAAAGLNTGLAFALVPRLKHVGTALAIVATETFIAGAMHLFLKSEKADLFSQRVKNGD